MLLPIPASVLCAPDTLADGPHAPPLVPHPPLPYVNCAYVEFVIVGGAPPNKPGSRLPNNPTAGPRIGPTPGINDSPAPRIELMPPIVLAVLPLPLSS